jgi:hypothetical protein
LLRKNLIIVFGDVLLHQNKLVFGLNLFLKGLLFQNLLSKERSFSKKGYFCCAKTL